MVADTFSATLGVLLMGTGNDNNTWGNNANTSDFQIFEDAIANIFTSSAVSGTVDLSGTPPPAGPSQARFWQLKFTASLAGILTVQVPNLTKEWVVNNACTLNGFSLQMKTPSGSAVTIPQGWWRVWCDGSNVINVWPQGQLQNQMPAANATGPSYSFAAEANSGFYRALATDLRVAVAGLDIFSFTPFGVNIIGNNKLITVATTGNTHGNTTIDNLPTDLRGLGLEGAFVEITGASLGTTIVSINSASSMTVSGTIAGTNTGAALRILPWGQGDGSTTFNIPDRRGIVLAGRDNMGGTAKGNLTLAQSQGILGTKLNATGGEQGHAQTLAEAPTGQFTFNFNDPGHGHATTPANPNVGQNASGAGFTTGNAGSFGANAVLTINSNTTGITASISDHAGGGAHNNVQPTGICNYIIKR